MFTYVVRSIHDDENVMTYAYPKVLASNSPKDGFGRYYQVFNDKNRYLKERLGKKDSIADMAKTFSFYSLVFYDTNEEDVPVRFIQSNFTENANLYKYFLPENIEKRKKKEKLVQLTPLEEDEENTENDTEETNTNQSPTSHKQLYGMSEEEKQNSLWDARSFRNFSVPPRSRLYLFQYPDFKGRSFVFDNPKNSHIVFSLDFVLDDDVSSYKWFTMYPNTQKFKTKNPEEEQIFRRFVTTNVGFQINEEILQKNPDLNLPTFVLSEDKNNDVIISKLHAS